MRIKNMITQDEFSWYLTTSPNYFYLKLVESRKENLYFESVSNIKIQEKS